MEESVKDLWKVRILYNSSTTLGLEPVSSCPPQIKKLHYAMQIGVLFNPKCTYKILDSISSSPPPLWLIFYRAIPKNLKESPTLATLKQRLNINIYKNINNNYLYVEKVHTCLLLLRSGLMSSPNSKETSD